jgi:hypothetical protein
MWQKWHKAGRALVQRFVHMQNFASFKFTPSSSVDQRPLRRFLQSTYHHTALEDFFSMMSTTRLLLAIVVIWVIHACGTQYLLSLQTFLCTLHA